MHEPEDGYETLGTVVVFILGIIIFGFLFMALPMIYWRMIL